MYVTYVTPNKCIFGVYCFQQMAQPGDGRRRPLSPGAVDPVSYVALAKYISLLLLLLLTTYQKIAHQISQNKTLLESAAKHPLEDSGKKSTGQVRILWKNSLTSEIILGNATDN